MKNFTQFWIFLIGIIGLSVNAQQVKYEGLDKDYTQSMDSLLTYVDKSKINTGILYDRVFTFIHLENEQDTIVSDYRHFIQSWHELHKASYNPDFFDVERLKTDIKANSDKVYLGVINTKINYIDYGTDSLPNLTFSDGYFKNIEGIDPIREKQVTVIAPLREKVFSDTVVFRINNDFMLQKSGVPVKDLEADFGDGISRQLIANSVVLENDIVIRYEEKGIKEIVFKVTYADNSFRLFWGLIEVILSDFFNNQNTEYPLEENFVGANGITQNNSDNIAFQGYNDVSPSKSSLEYRTYYNLITNDGSEQSKIAKPIIILDGFDPGDKRKIYQGSVGYNPDDKSIYELMEYDHDSNLSTQPLNLVQQLRSAPYGFDVTLVNFTEGADYIERNAMALVALLKRENQKLAQNGSTEEIIIVGPSMGGLYQDMPLLIWKRTTSPTTPNYG
jgi:hypothetical protein